MNQRKPYIVIKLKCPYCGEEKYVVYFCEHCGSSMEYDEYMEMDLHELKELMRKETVEAYGHPDQVTAVVSDLDSTEPTESVSSFSVSDLDTLMDEGTLREL